MTPMRELRVGIVGCGQMGRKHAVNCSRMAGLSVVAVVDGDQDRAAALSKETGATAYSDVQAMIRDVSPDALVIATPPGERRAAIESGASARIPLLVEKPLALDMKSARAYCELVRNASIVNAVGFHLRYSPLTQQASTLISGKKVTHVRTMTTTSYYLRMDMPLWFLQRRHSGGPLLEQTLHVIDTVRYLVGDITQIVAKGDRLVRPDLNEFDSEDSIVLAYRFASGILGTHTDSCAMMEFNWEIELFGPDWRLKLDFARGRLEGRIDGEQIGADSAGVDLHMIEMKTFIAAARHDKQAGLLSSFADATKTLATVTAGDRSLVSGNWETVDGYSHRV